METEEYTGPHHFSLPAWISRAPFETLLSIEIIEAGQGQAVLKMPFLKSFAQGAGLMHGGALVSLADTAVVMAIKSILPPGTHFATVSMESRFVHPVKKGSLLARARVVARDGAHIKGECSVLDERGRTVMTFASLFKVARDRAIKTVRFGDAQYMEKELSASAQRVQRTLAEKGLDLKVVELPGSTRTAVEAAQAVGCNVAQIAISLVFRARQTSRAVLVIASGANRVDEKKIRALLGEPIGKADAEFVRRATGFAIGGVPPLGHPEPLPTFIDADLLQHATIWAAAGTPHALFALDPRDLVAVTGGKVSDVRAG
ncbi:MAG: YbaK/EbsC family protein [Desulfosarcinaceae bacterium]